MQVEVRGNEKWYIDSACSCHMTGNANQLSSLHKQSNGCVALGDKRRREILGTGETKINDNITVKQVSLVNELGFNLLSLSQLCDQGNNEAVFTSRDCYVRNSETKEVILKGVRFKNVYVVDHKYKPTTALCFASLADETQLWHKRFGHANHQLIHKLHTKELVRGLPKTQPMQLIQNPSFLLTLKR